MVRHPNECLDYDIKQSDSEAPVILELMGNQCRSQVHPGP